MEFRDNLGEKLKDNEMKRSVTQSLYKYLPEAWGDFYTKKTREMYTARIKSWNSDLLTDINSDRLIEKIKQNLIAFQLSGGVLDGFGELDNIGTHSYEIRTPKLSVNPDIFAEVNPLLFRCSNCNTVERFSTSANVSKDKINLSKCCNKPLKQIQLIYSCLCGWAGPFEVFPCKKHGFSSLRYNGRFGFVCNICNENIDRIKRCPKCNEIVSLKPALDGSHFIPFSLSSIDLINMREEKFLSKEGIIGAKIIIGKWLGRLSDEEYNKFIFNGISNEEDPGKKIEYDSLIKLLIDSGIMREQAEAIAKQQIYGLTKGALSKIEDYFETNIIIIDDYKINKCAANLLEYYRVFKGSDVNNCNNYISTLEDAKKISKKLNTSIDYDRYNDLCKSIGIKNIQACSNIPFINCSYGYSRKESDPQNTKKNVTLCTFPSESRINPKKNIYGVKLNTEGILIEFDKESIIKWIRKNKFIKDIYLPNNDDYTDENKLKEWFINNVDIEAIKPFSNIDKEENLITHYVYNLLHSASHALMKQAGELCGLDKNSLSEYIFPQVPAIFIYCQNSQGLSLGALFNLFEAYFDRWIKNTLNFTEKCIFDPICLDRDRACAGCLYINEISCMHFNKDLDRRYLVGHIDRATNERIYGFWEDTINGNHVSK